MRNFIRDLLFAKPWLAGMLCAALVILPFWIRYPINWDSRSADGKVKKATIVENDQLINTGSNGAISVSCYKLNVVFEFEIDHISHGGTQKIESCDYPSLKKKKSSLEGSNVNVIYSQGHLERTFLPELVSLSELKVAVGLAITFLLLGTWVAARVVGRFSIDALNIPLNKIPSRYVFSGIPVIFFYIWLLFG